MVGSPTRSRHLLALALACTAALGVMAGERVRPGTRMVSHHYDIGKTWKPAKSFVVDNHVVHFWTVSKR